MTPKNEAALAPGYGDRATARALIRHDLSSFIHRSFLTVSPGDDYMPNWHIDAIGHHLMEIAVGNITRLVVTVPPRSLKSICVSVAFPAFLLGHDPTRKCICASYSVELAAKLARDCRAVMESPWYRAIFPRTRLNPNKRAELEFETTAGGVRYATSLGGALTGFGGNLLIIDDPMKPLDALSEAKRESCFQWYSNTLLSRLDDKQNDAIVLVMQRLHVEDLVGCILEREPWVHLNLPAIAPADEAISIGHGKTYYRKAGQALHPAREPLELLDRIRTNMGSATFSAQYLQEPLPPEGNMVSLKWFRRYNVVPVRRDGDQMILSWDTASKDTELSDYSACTVWLIRSNGRPAAARL